MAKMIPRVIERNDPKRNGEYLVYDWMSNPKIPGYCFYSLPQKNHIYKIIGEVDFLYVCEQGLLCIEVKGGQDISRESLKWYSVNKKGEQFEIKDPFKQSRECMYALKDYITETYGAKSAESKFQLGYCVVFPECVANCRGNDIVTEVMFDCRFDLSDFKKFPSSVLKYWSDLEDIKHYRNRSTGLSESQVSQMVDLLQADFGSIPSMKLEIQNVEQEINNLSDEQMSFVSAIRYNKRIVVMGGAGTGKSLLALAKARIAVAENKKTLYLCFNKNMAQYARNNLPKAKYLEVRTFHSLMNQYLPEDAVYNLSVEKVCELFVKNHIIPEKYDVMVVDEAQDLMYDSVWDVMSLFMNKGIEKGEWVVLTDPLQSIFNDKAVYDDGFEYLCDLCEPAVIYLNKNWRNTKPIITRTSRLTDIPKPDVIKINGPKVEVHRHINNSKEVVKLLRRDIASLIMGGTPATNIVILSTNTLKNSSLADVTEICNLQIYEPQNIMEAKPNRLNFFTVQSFKGLESSVVFYIDIDGFVKLSDKKLNYVAMTRARALLYMYVFERADEEYNTMMDNNV